MSAVRCRQLCATEAPVSFASSSASLLGAARRAPHASLKPPSRSSCHAVSEGYALQDHLQEALAMSYGVDPTLAAPAGQPDARAWVQQGSQSSKNRQQLPTIVVGTGKAPETVASIMLDLAQKQRSVLAIRIEPEMYAAVRKLAPGVKYNMRSKTLAYSLDGKAVRGERLAGTVALVAAGECSLQVVEEVNAVAEALGCYLFRINDSNASALQSIFQNLQAICSADVVVVVTGPDMSLPSVVAELVDTPVIAVPTSMVQTGSLGGLVPMLSALTASTPGVSVVSIDNGCAAAVMAARILASATRLHRVRSAAEAAAQAQADAVAALQAAELSLNAAGNGMRGDGLESAAQQQLVGSMMPGGAAY